MKPTPLLVVDLETTGLCKKRSQILQLAAIYAVPLPGWTGVERVTTLNLFVDNGPITYGEPFALQMNAAILKHIANSRSGKADPNLAYVLPVEQAKKKWSEWLQQVQPEGKFNLAGKSAGNFDLPILENQGFDVSRISHRILDLGGLYFPDFGYVPSFSEIQKLLGLRDVTHDALSDCNDVLVALFAKMEREKK